jgi:hypothetical protein
MRSRALGLALLALALSGSAAAAAADLKSLAWMAGTWTGVADSVEMEEIWTAPKAQSMLGLHRDAAEGRTVSFEFLRIEATSEAITYWASPKGRPATPFKLVEGGQKRVVFENPEHDFPRRILYWLGDDGSLHARVEGTRAGKAFSEEWRWVRAPAN